MIDADGNIRFINSGVLNINASSSDDSFGTKEYMDLHNTGTVNIAAAVNFGKVINESTITVTNSGTLKFYGALTNNGTISGPGFVEIFYSADGSGSFKMTEGSKVTYHYDLSNGNKTTYYIDSDGFWRIGGQVVADAYGNRPVYRPELNGWAVLQNGQYVKVSDASEYVDVTVGQDGFWYIGGNKTTEPVGDLVWNVELNQQTHTWELVGTANPSNKVDTGISEYVSQNVYGGSVVNLTVGGDATLPEVNGVRTPGSDGCGQYHRFRCV